MKLFFLGVMLAAAGVTPVFADTLLDDSRALVESFGAQLQSALQAAMSEGGPAAAMTVCKDQAPQIASELSRQSGAKVTRTSRRFRNPANAPEVWQIEILEAFESATDGAASERLERNANGARYMNAIRIQPVCLVCHGDALSDEVSATLDEHYPHDRARGYALGDLRGAFSVSWPVSENLVPQSAID